MRRTRFLAFAAGAGAIIALVALPAAPALAHAERTVGPYTVAIGFGAEPAYTGVPNSVEVIVHRTSTGAGVDTATDTLKATVGYGSRSMPVTFEPNFDPDLGGSPGDYRAAFVPTAPGTYTFHVTGSIDGTKIDETVTSGPTTFVEVTDPTTIEFPTKVPSLGAVSQRLDREVPRLDAAIRAAGASADHAASSAKAVGYAGLGAGVLALLVAGVSLVRGRPRSG